MSNKTNTDEELAAELKAAEEKAKAEAEMKAAEEKAAKAAAKAAEKAAKEGYPCFMKALKGFGYRDPDTNIRYDPAVPTKVEVAPAKGSWLACQIEAGLIGKA